MSLTETDLTRSLTAGNGSSAGFAWPIFGLIFGCLGLTISGIGAIILGLISFGLFIYVFIQITYFAYENYSKEMEELQNQLKDNEDRIIENTYNYLITIKKKCIFKRENTIGSEENKIDSAILVADMKALILAEIKQSNPDLSAKFLSSLQHNNVIEKFVNETNNNDNVKLNNINYSENQTLINQKTTTILDARQEIRKAFRKNNHFVPKPLTQYEKFKNGFSEFIGGFGSVGGGGAGAYGLLCGVGLVPLLSAVPVAGWIILGGAVVFGCVMAGIAIHNAYKKNNYHQLIHHRSAINDELAKLDHSSRNDFENMQQKLIMQQKLEKKRLEAMLNNQNQNKEIRKRTRSQSVDLKSRSPSVDFSLLQDKYSLWSKQRECSFNQTQQNITPVLSYYKKSW